MKNSNLFYGCTTSSEVEQRYQELSRVFRSQDELLKSLNEEYSTLMSVLNSANPVEVSKEKVPISEKIKELLEKVNTEGLHLELIKNWIWISGSTYSVKDQLKQIRFRYSLEKLVILTTFRRSRLTIKSRS